MRLCGETRWQLDIQGSFVNLRFAQKVAASEIPYGLLPGLAKRATVAQSEPQVGAVISAAVQPGAFSAAGVGNPRLIPVPYRHEAPTVPTAAVTDTAEKCVELYDVRLRTSC